MPSRKPVPWTPARGQRDCFDQDEPRAENPLVHQAVLPVAEEDHQQMFAGARSCFTSWLESKGLATQLSSDVRRLTDACTLTVTDSHDAEGHQAALRLRLREDKEEDLADDAHVRCGS